MAYNAYNDARTRTEYYNSRERAQRMTQNPQEAQRTVEEAEAKANRVKGLLGGAFLKLKLMFGLIKDYFAGDYNELPVGTIVSVLGAIIYFLSPIDAIPDFIPVIGYLDDAGVIGIVAQMVSNDLEKYAAWLRNMGRI